MRKLTTKQIISALIPIPNSDFIELLKFKDVAWQCVSKKGEFKVGDECLYFEIDSILNCEIPAFDFLNKDNRNQKTVNCLGKQYKGFRVKTAKFRGSLSQGLALPLSAFDLPPDVEDYDKHLGIVKYDPLVLVQDTAVSGEFPTHLVPKTDSTRIQSLGNDYFDRWKDTDLIATEKLEGMSCTIIIEKEGKKLCQRNYEVAQDVDNPYNLATKRINFPEGYSVQGEIVGEKVQKNLYKIQGLRFYCFSVFDLKAKKYLPKLKARQFCDDYHITFVPIIYQGTMSEFAQNIDQLLTFAEGKSKLCDTQEREGLVWNSLSEIPTETLEARVNFKTISNKYLLKNL
jgi:RNA ligase (TIGR02306 family)